MGSDNQAISVADQLANAHMRLFGGAQYHRAMAEFRAGAQRSAGVPCPCALASSTAAGRLLCVLPVSIPNTLPGATGPCQTPPPPLLLAGVGTMACPDISREEIVNACGVDELHDGVNYTRTACVIAISKAQDLFEPFLHQVRLGGSTA